MVRKADPGSSNVKGEKCEYGIFFLYHDTGPETRNNLALLRYFNPGVPIIPINQWSNQVFPGGYRAKKLSTGKWRAHRPRWFGGTWKQPLRRLFRGVDRSYVWRNGDLSVYQWITQYERPHAERWIITEWDCFCTTNLRWVYQDVWDADIAATNVHQPEQDAPWHFARERPHVPDSYRPHLAGLAPLAGILVRAEVLYDIAQAVLKEPAWRKSFCEVRIATVANALGFEAEEIARAKPFLAGNKTFPAHAIQGRGLWHKVKDHDPMVSPESLSQPACSNTCSK